MRKYIVIILVLLLAGVGVVLMAGDNPDWTLPVSIKAQEIGYLTVDVAAQSMKELNVRITSQESPVQVDLVTPQLDVNVTNSVLNVQVQGTANVNVENAQLNVRNLREQVVDLTHIEGFSSSIYVSPTSEESETVFTNNENITVYLEYFSVAGTVGGAYLPADTLSKMSITVTLYLKDQNNNTVIMLVSNGGMFLNLDPAIPIPPGYKLEVKVANTSSKGLFVDVAGIIRKIAGV